MNIKNQFLRIMEKYSEIALATSVNNQPNVRIVNFYYEIDSGTLFFNTFSDNHKVNEFISNSKIAFTTIPHEGTEHVKAKGIVKKSSRDIIEVEEQFINKIPDYKEMLEQSREYLILYEIKFQEAVVTLDFENIDIIKLNK